MRVKLRSNLFQVDNTPLLKPYKTGQTTSFQNGDSGYYQKGFEIPSRFVTFTESGKSLVYDKFTNLVWPQNWTDATSDKAFPFLDTWANMLTYCEAKSYAGYSDWRMPNVNEALSLLNFGQMFPVINTVINCDLAIGGFWCAETSPLISTSALSFAKGVLGVAYGLKTNTNGVIFVRDYISC